ncbi:hypothetical protein RFI_05403, partial [Reticulomyxa filosa]
MKIKKEKKWKEVNELMTEYCEDTHANAMFLYELISDWANEYLHKLSCSNSNNSSNNNNNTNEMSQNGLWMENYLVCCNEKERTRKVLFRCLSNVVCKASFRHPVQKNAWAMTIIAILSTKLLSLCVHCMKWLTSTIVDQNSNTPYLSKDEFRHLVMFLRIEVLEECAELVAWNTDVFKPIFFQLFEALCDDYLPFRGWLFCRICKNGNGGLDKELQIQMVARLRKTTTNTAVLTTASTAVTTTVPSTIIASTNTSTNTVANDNNNSNSNSNSNTNISSNTNNSNNTSNDANGICHINMDVNVEACASMLPSSSSTSVSLTNTCTVN